MSTTMTDVFSRDTTGHGVLVADGFGVSLSVSRGHLVIRDGLGRHRRERALPRAQRTVRRIVILGHSGQLTLEAVRWCADTGIALVQLDASGPVLLSAGAPGPDDARLRRAQAAAAGSPVGVDLARELLTRKIRGQADVADTALAQPHVASGLRELVKQLETADLLGARELEAQASNSYFSIWSSVECRFAARDADRVPKAWGRFAVRRSPINRGRSPRNAADPVNALLNYSYALAEAECRLAAIAVGLDPGLGISHTDKKARDSLVLDLLEPVRPTVETVVLALLRQRFFRASDFHETPQGACRLLPPLTHELAEHMPTYARAIAPIAEHVAHALAGSSPGPIELRTPLTRSNTTRAQQPGARPARRGNPSGPKPSATCRNCGTPLAESRRQLCPACWPVSRAAIATEASRQRAGKLAELRREGSDPTNTAEARAQRSQTLSARKREQLAWEAARHADELTAAEFAERVLPALRDVPLSAIQAATGLSLSACSRIRSRSLMPHARHWRALHDLVETPTHV